MSDDAIRPRDVAPPQNIEAEEAVLGAILLEGGMVARLLEAGLTPADFYRGAWGTVFAAAITVHGRSGGGLDVLTLADELKRTGSLEDVGGRAAIDYLAGAVPNVGNVLEYAAVIRREAFLRRRREAALAVFEGPDQPERWTHLLRAADAPLDTAHAHRQLDLTRLVALAETEPPWRCAQLAADGHVTTLVGRGGEGKSLLTLALAGAVQLGSNLAGIQCVQGKVVIFDAENGPWIMGSRMKSASTPTHALEVYDAEGLDLTRHRSWITARAEGAQLVIFDSIRTLAAGAKENDSDDMAPIMGAIRHVARSTGAAVIAIHHRGKGEGDFRGSSALRDQTDLMFVLERDVKDPEQRWRRALRCVKCRIAEEPPVRWIGLRRHRGALTLTEAAPYVAEEYARPARDELEEEIAGIVADRGPITRGDIAEVLGRTRKDGTVRRALGELVEDGLVHKVSGHRYIMAPVGGASLSLAPPDTPGTLPGVDGVPALKGNGTLAPPESAGA